MLPVAADAPQPCKNVLGKTLSNSIACVADERIQLQPVVELLTCAARRGIAQSGSASALGAEGRGFESLCPDQFSNCVRSGTSSSGSNSPLTGSATLQSSCGCVCLGILRADAGREAVRHNVALPQPASPGKT
jgi:hypothetical protein